MRATLSFAHAAGENTALRMMATALPQVPYEIVVDGSSVGIMADLNDSQLGALKAYVDTANEMCGGEFRLLTAQPA